MRFDALTNLAWISTCRVTTHKEAGDASFVQLEMQANGGAVLDLYLLALK